MADVIEPFAISALGTSAQYAPPLPLDINAIPTTLSSEPILLAVTALFAIPVAVTSPQITPSAPLDTNAAPADPLPAPTSLSADTDFAAIFALVTAPSIILFDVIAASAITCPSTGTHLKPPLLVATLKTPVTFPKSV